MGCDIHSFAEVKKDGKWLPIESDGRTSSWGLFFERDSEFLAPFDWRNYSMFGFLADVRNYSHCTPIAEPKGLPEDSEYLNSTSKYAYDRSPMSGEAIPESEREKVKDDLEDSGYHSHSWLTLKELVDFDYEKTFWDRRISRTTYNESGGSFTDGAALANEGEGETITYREHLGEAFFEEIELLKQHGQPEDVRIIFYFDN